MRIKWIYDAVADFEKEKGELPGSVVASYSITNLLASPEDFYSTTSRQAATIYFGEPIPVQAAHGVADDEIVLYAKPTRVHKPA